MSSPALAEAPPLPPVSFPESALLFSRFAAQLDPATLPPLRPGAPHAAVIITPWCNCPVAWFSLTLAWLLRRQGLAVSLVWNDICDISDAAGFARETELIGDVLRLFPSFPLLRLSQQPPIAAEIIDGPRLTAAAHANALWLNRGSLPREQVAALQGTVRPILERSLPHVESLFVRHAFDFAVVPGGMFGNSGLFVQIGRARGVRMSTFDANPGNILIGLRDTASCCPDVPRCVQAVDTVLGVRQSQARAIARGRLQDRMAATERFFTEQGYVGQPVQMLSVDKDRNSYDHDVVIPLNVEWDGAALGLHRFFRDDCEWLLETVGFLLAETAARVAVRQHPGNRVVVDGAANLEQALQQRFGGHPRFRFIQATEEVNTYKLLQGARLVLPFTTTVGIEAAMLGKPLVLESRAYYADQPFVVSCADRASYFSTIAAHLRQPPPPDPDKIAAAELTYFFSAVCNFVPTRLTPHPEDFAQWVQQTPAQVAQAPGVQTIVAALAGDVPTAALQSGSILDRHAAASATAPAAPVPAVGAAPASRPALSLVLPGFRDRASLARLLDGLAARPDRDFELVVINDGGGSVESLLAGYQPGLSITYVRRGGPGDPASARAAGQAFARGQRVVFISDGDDPSIAGIARLV